MNILLTAANSFIGSNLGAHLHNEGHALAGTVRKDRYDSFKPPWLSRSFILDLAEPRKADLSMFGAVNVLVHLAHDFRRDMTASNIESTVFLAETAARAGVERQIYFSSYSARPDAVSEYGTVKHRLERYFLERGQIIVRPGLVIGNGGMFLKFLNAVRKYPVIPLIDGGKGEVPVISIRQVCEIIGAIISSPSRGTEFNLFYPEMVSMRALTEIMKSVAGSKALLAPVPLSMVLFAAGFCNLLGLKLPFDIGSARSFKKNQQRIHESNIACFLDSYDSVLDAVEAAFLAGDLKINR